MKFNIGDHVSKVMGCRMEGKVVAPFFWKDSNDGTYRAPVSGDKPVWVQWNNGTKGWIHASFVEVK